jgi:hypothetical protein
VDPSQYPVLSLLSVILTAAAVAQVGVVATSKLCARSAHCCFGVGCSPLMGQTMCLAATFAVSQLLTAFIGIASNLGRNKAAAVPWGGGEGESGVGVRVGLHHPQGSQPHGLWKKKWARKWDLVIIEDAAYYWLQFRDDVDSGYSRVSDV